MRIWRDIFPASQWEQYVKTLDKPLFNRGVITDLTNLLTRYHLYDKTAVENLTPRRSLLQQIESEAVEYLNKYKITSKDAVTEKTNQNPTFKESDFLGVVWVLARRAHRKAGYLGLLAQYCETNIKEFGSVYEVHELIRKDDHQDGLLGLTRGVVLEKLDPAHRNYEMTLEGTRIVETNSAISCAFRDWFLDFKANKTDRPFFLWLEAHPLCTAQGKHAFSSPVVTGEPMSKMDFGPKDVTSVNYATEEAVSLVVVKDAHLYELFDKEWAFVDEEATVGKLLDTSSIAKSKAGPGFAAYVWTKSGELVVEPHTSNQVHHSSLVGGDRVRCAGMIKVAQGKVVAVSNDSGHYQPTTMHFTEFLKFLKLHGVIVPNPEIHDMSK